MVCSCAQRVHSGRDRLTARGESGRGCSVTAALISTWCTTGWYVTQGRPRAHTGTYFTPLTSLSGREEKSPPHRSLYAFAKLLLAMASIVVQLAVRTSYLLFLPRTPCQLALGLAPRRAAATAGWQSIHRA